MKNIGIFLGSFDPIHHGHVMIASKAAKILDEVLIVPLHDAPHKQKLSKGVHRIKMCQLATESYNKIQVFTKIIDCDISGYSMDLIHTIQSTYPHDQLYYIVGSDVFQHILSWPSIDCLATMVKFFVFIRDDFYPNITEDQLGTSIIYENLNLDPISSSEIKINQAYERLDSKVVDYIRLHKLYK